MSTFIIGIATYGITYKDFFQREKLKEMNVVIEEIKDYIDEDYNNRVDEKLEGLSEKYSVQIDIKNAITLDSIFSSHKMGKNNMMNGQHRFEVIEFIDEKEGISETITLDKSTGVEFLTVVGNSESSYEISVKTPITVIDDAVNKSIKLLFMIMLPVGFIALFITALFSKQFTKPVIEITKKTRKIEELDFSEGLNIKSMDEIGTLAKSVNNLSFKIEETLKNLKEKNLVLETMMENERKNQLARREFVSSVSHELKSPITVISGYIQALQGGFISSDEDRKYYLDVIGEETERLGIIVNDLLELYKLESNTFKLNKKGVNINSLIKKILDKNKFRFEELNINLNFNEGKNVTVFVDEVRLEQAVQNYINNALSHVDENKIIEIDLKVSEDNLVIYVYNSGSNIEDENLNKIWEGFVRVDKVRNYKEKRLGLGLAIVKQIVTLHEGTYGVKNKEQGVEFWITLKL
ncbi:HAMP domain-containing sensor histidine kinase [Clostridium subterminale]|uniref:HAMP domain-containing sensor histidine kinase n=1 Tax=Clostridium subterminale TaxID=1550 RepID=UPI0031D9F687